MDGLERRPAPILAGDAEDPLFQLLLENPSLANCTHVCVRGFTAWAARQEKPPGCVVLHAVNPEPSALRWFSEWRRLAGKQIRLILSTSLTARYRQLEPWYGVCDALISEVTAVAAIGRYIDNPRPSEPDPAARRRRITVISPDFEMRVMLADACQRAGYRARPVRTWAESRGGSIAVWDVPVLQDHWMSALNLESRRRRIVGIAGFCDRSILRAMCVSGASACLDLPFQVEDLGWVLDRVAASPAPERSFHTGHQVPGASNLAVIPAVDASRSLGRVSLLPLE